MAQIKKKFIKFGTTADSVNSRVIPAFFTPTNYTPTQVASEGSTFISAHLNGIDQALATAGGGTTGTASLANNQTSLASITGLSFNGASVRTAIIEFSVSRSTSTTEKNGSGKIVITYNTLAADWYISVQSDNSNAGLVFDITSAGQVQYTSSNLSGASYVGQMRFKYNTFAV